MIILWYSRKEWTVLKKLVFKARFPYKNHMIVIISFEHNSTPK